MHRIWPAGDPRQVDDTELTALYRSPAGSCVRVNFVTSVDGAVEVQGYSAGLGNPADHKVFGLLRMFPHALMVGAGTLRQEGYHAVRLDEPRRAWRQEHGLRPYPRLVVVSARLALDPAHPALAEAPVRPVILTHAMAPPDRVKALSEVADVLVHGVDEVDLARGLAQLRSRGMTQILCEGGPHLFGSLTAADLVDEVCLTVSPMLTGAGAGRITAGPASTLRGLRLAHALFDDGALLLRYARKA
ncbi:MAG: pyrimidine reductase family protein [Micromonosporaceae bacterium]|nr:pyrimidine reductase family protein [Micromonosporaceae bacterium]